MNNNARPPRSKEEISLILQEFEQSHLSKKEFCQQKQINYQTFIGWTVQRRNRSGPAEKKFIPVQVQSKPEGIFAEVHLSSSRKIILYQAVSPEVFQAILKC